MSLAIIETNEVHLIGRLAKPPETRATRSGEEAVSFDLKVRRPPEAVQQRRGGDDIECVSARAATIKAAAGWTPGDVLEVRGSLRRHWWRDGAKTMSRYEIEVATLRRVTRASAAKPRRKPVSADVA